MMTRKMIVSRRTGMEDCPWLEKASKFIFLTLLQALFFLQKVDKMDEDIPRRMKSVIHGWICGFKPYLFYFILFIKKRSSPDCASGITYTE
jgi:hypothetical protein